MNNTVENDFFWIYQGSYSGYSIQVRWANVQANDVKFSRDLTTKNH